MADLRRMLHRALDAFAPFSVLPDDGKPDNYHFVSDKVMVVDLERVSDGLTDKKELPRETLRGHATQDCFLDYGLITTTTNI